MGDAVDTRAEYDALFGLYVPIAIAVCILVGGAVVLAALRGRRRREASARDEAPLAESVFAISVAVIAGVLIAFTVRAEHEVTSLDDDPGLVVDVVAFQWQWRFDYPASGVGVVGAENRVPTLVVPVDTTVRFRLTSRDVIHSFYIPERRFKRDAFPDHVSRFDLRWDRIGTYDGHCAEYCGLWHDRMLFDVAVVSAPAFRAWLARAAAEPGPVIPPPGPDEVGAPG